MIEITVGSLSSLDDIERYFLRGYAHEQRRSGKRTRSCKTERRRRVRKSTRKIAGNLGGSEEYLSEIDILSPLTSSPERSSVGIRLNLLYKNLNSFVSFSDGLEEAALFSSSFFYLPVFFLAHPCASRSPFIDPVSANISFICKTHDFYPARFTFHFSFPTLLLSIHK